MFRFVGMEYRCVATSVAGFVQQLVSCYLPHGYWFYVCGIVPKEKDPRTVDLKLLEQYGIGISRQSRARRKAVGNRQRPLHPLSTPIPACWQPTAIIRFSKKKTQNIRDARHVPIKFAGYSISVAAGGFKPKSATNGALSGTPSGESGSRSRRNGTRG